MIFLILSHTLQFLIRRKYFHLFFSPIKFGNDRTLCKQNGSVHEILQFPNIAGPFKSIRPEIQEKMYQRSNTKVTKVKGSHAVYISQPDAVARVIIDAAENESKTK